MDEGFILTPETEPAAVAELRRKALRMDGPMVDEADAAAANSAEPKRFYKASAALSRAAFTKLLERALTMAGSHVDSIRAGEAAPAPASVGRETACRFCQARSACLFDEAADRDRLRRVKDDRAAVLERLNAEDGA